MRSEEPSAILQAWGLAQPAARGPRARLSLTDIAHAACALADEEGFDTITLGAVAGRLGLTTTGLYRYVDSKDTLVELVVDAALGAPPAGLAATDVGGWVDAVWHRYTTHPWLATFPLRRAPRAPNAFAWMESLVILLRAQEDPAPLGTAMTVDVLVRGYAGLAQAEAASAMSPDLLATIAERHPALSPGPETLETPRVQLSAVLDRLLVAPHTPGRHSDS